MSLNIACNGHKFVKSSLFRSPSYLTDLSPYISAVISSRLLATPIQLTTSAIKPLVPLAQSILPTKAANFISSGTLTCEYCLHQVTPDTFDDGRICPSLLLGKLRMPESEFILHDLLIEAQDKARERDVKSQVRSAEEQTQSSGNSDTKSDTTKPNSSSKHDISSDISSNSSSQADDSNKGSGSINLNDEISKYKDDLLIMQICPEIGLHAQKFACAHCDKNIDLDSSRLCHYDGRYYCYSCHTGSELSPIPARVLRNWDFTPKPVSRSSMQKICFLRTKPVLFNLFQINPMLYGFIDRLVEIKQIRERIQSMLKYVEICNQPNRPYLIPVPKHFLSKDLLNFYTLNDLYDINHVHDLLCQLQSTLEAHIVKSCESCRGKGYFCELCKDPMDILYPFSKNGASCNKCHTVYHKNCFQRKKKNCPRCIRISSKMDILNSQEASLSTETKSN